MIKTKKSAVTAISYGLIAALVIVVFLGALTAAGVDIETIFSIAGNALSSVMTPNPNLTAEQQSEVANAVAEIAAGTASAACLQYMNNAANAASMANSGATCLGPGMGIAPPSQPVKLFQTPASQAPYIGSVPIYTYQNGQIYAEPIIGIAANGVGANKNFNTPGLWLYADGFIARDFNWVSCAWANHFAYTNLSGSTVSGDSSSCYGGAVLPNFAYWGWNRTQSAPFGYVQQYTW